MIGHRRLKSFFKVDEVPREFLIVTRKRNATFSVRVDWELFFYSVLAQHEIVMRAVAERLEGEHITMRRASPRDWPDDLT